MPTPDAAAAEPPPSASEPALAPFIGAERISIVPYHARGEELAAGDPLFADAILVRTHGSPEAAEPKPSSPAELIAAFCPPASAEPPAATFTPATPSPPSSSATPSSPTSPPAEPSAPPSTTGNSSSHATGLRGAMCVALLCVAMTLAQVDSALSRVATSPAGACASAAAPAPPGDAWAFFKAKAPPRPAWALDVGARTNASLVRVKAPLGSRLEVFATARRPFPAMHAGPRVLAFRLARTGDAPLVWPALLASLPLCGAAFAIGGALGRREPKARGALVVCAAAGFVLAAIVWYTRASAVYHDGMELVARDVTLIRSWGGARSIAARIAGADVSTVEPFRVTAGLFDLRLDGAPLHKVEDSFLTALIAKHLKAVDAEAFWQPTVEFIYRVRALISW